MHPVLLIHAPDESRAVDYVTMLFSLPTYDPLLQHMALVLRAVLAAEGEAGLAAYPRGGAVRLLTVMAMLYSPGVTPAAKIPRLL